MNVVCFCLTENRKYPMERNVAGIITWMDGSSGVVLDAVMNIGRDKMKIKRWEKERNRHSRKVTLKLIKLPFAVFFLFG